jgi:hypothetical protein
VSKVPPHASAYESSHRAHGLAQVLLDDGHFADEPAALAAAIRLVAEADRLRLGERTCAEGQASREHS